MQDSDYLWCLVNTLLDREEEVAPEELLPLFRWDTLPRKDLTLSIGEKI